MSFLSLKEAPRCLPVFAVNNDIYSRVGETEELKTGSFFFSNYELPCNSDLDLGQREVKDAQRASQAKTGSALTYTSRMHAELYTSGIS